MRVRSHVCSKVWAFSNTNEASKQQKLTSEKINRELIPSRSPTFLFHKVFCLIFSRSWQKSRSLWSRRHKKKKESRPNSESLTIYIHLGDQPFYHRINFRASKHTQQRQTKKNSDREKENDHLLISRSCCSLLKCESSPRRSRRKLLWSENLNSFFTWSDRIVW